MTTKTITTPLVFEASRRTRNTVYDFMGDDYVLKDEGCIIFRGDDKAPRQYIDHLDITDQRENAMTPALALKGLKSSALNRVSVNSKNIGCRITQCWDVTIRDTTFVQCSTGLEIRDNCNAVKCSHLRVEQCTLQAVLATRCRFVVFDHLCKFHGRGRDQTPRPLLVFGNCGVKLWGDLHHGRPHPNDGLILIYGGNSERMVICPTVNDCGPGEIVVERNVGERNGWVIAPIEFRQPSKVDPRPKTQHADG